LYNMCANDESFTSPFEHIDKIWRRYTKITPWSNYYG